MATIRQPAAHRSWWDFVLRVLHALRASFLRQGPLSPRERRGYRFWGPVVAAILVVESLGAAADWWNRSKLFGLPTPGFLQVRWPTISSTVGHLETLSPILGVAVVGVIAVTAFRALTRDAGDATPVETTALSRGQDRIRRYYEWSLWVVLALAITVSHFAFDENYKRGYVIYGTLLAFGIVAPTILGQFYKYRPIPPLFWTVNKVRARWHWIATAIVAGLAILVIHLAFYPWPDLVRTSSEYAYLTESKADTIGARKLDYLGLTGVLTLRSAGRGYFGTTAAGDPQEAWLLDYESKDGSRAGCVIAVFRSGKYDETQRIASPPNCKA